MEICTKKIRITRNIILRTLVTFKKKLLYYRIEQIIAYWPAQPNHFILVLGFSNINLTFDSELVNSDLRDL